MDTGAEVLDMLATMIARLLEESLYGEFAKYVIILGT